MAEISPTRRLVLSSDELRQLTRWPEAMIVDYQGILQDIIDLASQVDDQDAGIAARVANIEQHQSIEESRLAGLINAQRRKASNLEQLIYAW